MSWKKEIDELKKREELAEKMGGFKKLKNYLIHQMKFLKKR